MEDCFIIFYDGKVLVTLTGFKGAPLPTREMILDWYAGDYAFERAKLTGGFVHSIPVGDMKFEDFKP
jgi:hypothetical protein